MKVLEETSGVFKVLKDSSVSNQLAWLPEEK
jgi:hypothetical protein